MRDATVQTDGHKPALSASLIRVGNVNETIPTIMEPQGIKTEFLFVLKNLHHDDVGPDFDVGYESALSFSDSKKADHGLQITIQNIIHVPVSYPDLKFFASRYGQEHSFWIWNRTRLPFLRLCFVHVLLHLVVIQLGL